MPNKTQMSSKTKKILTGVGICFGTVMVFIVSFILAFSLIISPPSIFSANESDVTKENEKLKAEIQTMNDTIEHLNTTVDKYKAQASAPSTSTPAVVTTPAPGTSSPSANSGGSQTTQTPQQNDAAGANGSSEGTGGGEADGEFTPDTVDSSGSATPEDVEIPIIDISE